LIKLSSSTTFAAGLGFHLPRKTELSEAEHAMLSSSVDYSSFKGREELEMSQQISARTKA
jgi:hypothetical protein